MRTCTTEVLLPPLFSVYNTILTGVPLILQLHQSKYLASIQQVSLASLQQVALAMLLQVLLASHATFSFPLELRSSGKLCYLNVAQKKLAMKNMAFQ